MTYLFGHMPSYTKTPLHFDTCHLKYRASRQMILGTLPFAHIISRDRPSCTPALLAHALLHTCPSGACPLAHLPVGKSSLDTSHNDTFPLEHTPCWHMLVYTLPHSAHALGQTFWHMPSSHTASCTYCSWLAHKCVLYLSWHIQLHTNPVHICTCVSMQVYTHTQMLSPSKQSVSCTSKLASST